MALEKTPVWFAPLAIPALHVFSSRVLFRSRVSNQYPPRTTAVPPIPGAMPTRCRCWWGCAQKQTACRVPVNATTASCQTHHPRNRQCSRRRLIVAAVEKAQQFFPDHMNVSDGKQVGISGRPTSDRAAAVSAGASAAAHEAPARKLFDPHPGRQIAACTPQAQRTGRKAHASQHRVHNLLFMTVAAQNHEDQGSRQLMFLPTACFSARLAAVCHSHTQS